MLLTSFANLDRYPGLRMWVSKFIEVDPLISLGTALTTHTVYQGLLWSLVILIPTLFPWAVFLQLDLPGRLPEPLRGLGVQSAQSR